MTARRIVSSFLSIVLILSLLPVAAFAQEPEKSNPLDDLGSVRSEEMSSADADVGATSDEVGSSEETATETFADEVVPQEGGDNAPIADDRSGIAPADPKSVDYIFIDHPELVDGLEQNIVIGVEEESSSLMSAELFYRIDGSDQECRLSAANAVEGAVLFKQTWDDSLPSGEYIIDRMEYVDGSGILRMIDLFQGERSGYRVLAPTDDIPEVTAYSLGDNGELEESVVTGAIEEAFAAPGKTYGISNRIKTKAQRDSHSTVIALDPGHGGSDPGADYAGLVEKTLNWKVANYCKAQLEAYGFQVYLTRSENECPDLDERVARAVRNNADLFVSIHMNSSENISAHGAEVWIQNPGSYLYEQTHTVGKDLGNRILSNLASLGLTNRGLKWDNLTSTYPDGSNKDYFAVLRHSREAGLPAILVEHGFLAGDYSFLSMDANLKRMGEADAEGIASYYQYGIAQACGDFYITDRNDFNGTFRVWATDVEPRFLTTKILIPVWPSYIDDASKIKFYEAKRDANGHYYVDVPASDYSDYRGRYFADCYSIAYGNQKKIAGTIICDLGKSSAMTNIDDVHSIKTSLVDPPQDISKIRYAVWSASGNQDDLKWIDASKVSSTQWGLNKLDLSSFSRVGVYLLDTYAVLRDGSLVKASGTSFIVDAPAAITRIEGASYAAGTYQVVVTGITNPFGTRSVKVPTWTSANGQDDIVWYSANRRSDGSYAATVNVGNHGYRSDTYISHVYLEGPRGDLYSVGSLSQKLTSSVRVTSWLDGTTAGLKVTGAGWTPANHIVQFAVWSAVNGQDDIVWLNATRYGSEWVAADALSSHTGSGTYHVHAYSKSPAGAMSYLGASSFEVSPDLMKYPIMGRTATSVSKMASCYRASGKPYPSYDLGKGGASSIDAFCQILYSEAVFEGVNAEVLFAQVMVETGWLQFGKDVFIHQFNFGGLGATGGVAGASFLDVRTGIRAQVQHLKAYASKAPLKNPCVDPRFDLVSRGIAPYAEDLQGKWAESPTYASSLRRQINALLKF